MTLNRAILANRTADHTLALQLIGEVDAAAVGFRTLSVRIRALAGVGRFDEAIEFRVAPAGRSARSNHIERRGDSVEGRPESAGVQLRNESLCMSFGSTEPKCRVPFENWNST